MGQGQKKDKQYVRNGGSFDLQKFLDSIVHVLHTLYLGKTQTPAVTDIIDSEILPRRFRVLAMDSTRLQDKGVI